MNAGIAFTVSLLQDQFVIGVLDEDLEKPTPREVDGVLESLSSLTVGPNAKIKANIKARDVTIHGTVRGSVEVTDKITIHQNGSLVGDIKTAGIVIDDGAYFKGSIDIVRPARNAPEVTEVHPPQREPVAQHK